VKSKRLDPDHLRIPKPAHPLNRREPLPWQCPKPAEEDPNAPARVQAILRSPSYRRADADVDFMARDSMRGVRLEIDYFKPELLFEQNHIRHTIVVFGSTRISEPASAQCKVDMLKAALAVDTGNKELVRRLAIAERILAKSRYYEVAREFGRLVSATHQSPHEQQRVVVTGGGPGIMEAANRGAFDVGAKSVGLNISLPHEQYPNPYITPDLCFSFHYFAMRKLHFLLRAKALVAFPGGYGTFDELFEVLTLVQTRKIKPIPVVLVGESYWREAFNLDFLVDEGVIDQEDRELFWFAETAEEIWNGILHWYDVSGEPLRLA
jgi:uncharacterized protein (TIGR00730 family)